MECDYDSGVHSLLAVFCTVFTLKIFNRSKTLNWRNLLIGVKRGNFDGDVVCGEGGRYFAVNFVYEVFDHEHILDEHNEAEHSYFCNICDRRFWSEDSFNQHNNAKHIYYCYECDRQFSSERSLEQHNAAKHYW